MTSPAVRARDTPDRAATSPTVLGVLIIDAENRRARYDCYRPGCPQPREFPPGGFIPAFARAIKTEHLARHHSGEQP